mmetsp:Transcript_21487/g.44875  ORF Transcript_21487/g.44875 Transcript_21487/m.44875 type:complete len:96 (-) Transcript_21487:124-411(-)
MLWMIFMHRLNPKTTSDYSEPALPKPDCTPPTSNAEQSKTTTLINGEPPFCPGTIFLKGEPANLAKTLIDSPSINCPITFLPSFPSISGTASAVI